MTIYNKLNKKSVMDFMKANFDTDMYHDVWEAIRTLSVHGFQDMKKLFEIMIEYDNELYANA